MQESPDAREAELKFAKHFERAQGWLLLEKYDFALAALEQIPPPHAGRPEVSGFRGAIYLQARRWAEAVRVIRPLRDCEPDDAGHWVNLAYALRRAESITAAETVLRGAAGRFPQEAVIWYNLACYASQQARFDEAAALLEKASRLDPKYARLAKDDPDFTPFWQNCSA